MRDISTRGIWAMIMPLILVFLVVCAPKNIWAQAPSPAGQAQKAADAAKPGQPCCDITNIDAATGVVTAKVNSTGQNFQFKAADAALLNSLKVGQHVFANFKTQQVSVDGAQPCCAMVSLAKGGVSAGGFEQDVSGAVNPGQPCCAITGIDASGIVTAQDKATGRTFQFQVHDSALLTSLHVGQSVSANFDSSQVAIAQGQPCCQIIGAGGASGGGITNTAGTSGSGSSSSGVIQSQGTDTKGVVADLTEASRSEGVLTMKMQFRNTSNQRVYLDVTRSLHCGRYYAAAGAKTYAVLKDAEGNYQMPVSAHCNDTVIPIEPGKSWAWWGKFQAPSATVKKISFFTPMMQPFENVPITDK